jgi:heme-degrading monooxygenase HmoA
LLACGSLRGGFAALPHRAALGVILFGAVGRRRKRHANEEGSMGLFIAMNHFQVAPERGDDFEAHWRKRESFLSEVPGFQHFALLRGDAGHYISHTSWDSREAFEAWTRSEAFHKAHTQARTPAGVLQGPPRLELYEAALEE